jgi:hypothetical protein
MLQSTLGFVVATMVVAIAAAIMLSYGLGAAVGT